MLVLIPWQGGEKAISNLGLWTCFRHGLFNFREEVDFYELL